MRKILTITIPCYNVEKYIRNCLDSFVIKEVMDDIEVLIINDGTKDSSADIAREYEKKYPSVFRVVDKENGGHGSTINIGIKEAKGAFFKVVDGDDWVEKDAFCNLVTILKQSSSDIVMSNFYWVDDATKSKTVEFMEPFVGVKYNEEYRFQDVADRLFIKMHSMTIRTDILKNNIPQIDEHCYYVDMEYVLFPIPYVKTITFIDEFVYMYRVGLPNQSMNPQKMQKNAVNYDRVLNRVLDYYKEQEEKKVNDKYLRYFEQVIGRMLATRIKIFLGMDITKETKKALLEFERNIKAEYPTIYSSVKNRAVICLRKSKYLLYRPAAISYRIKERLK